MVLVTLSRGTAGVRQTVKLDLDVLGGPRNPANVQSFAQSDNWSAYSTRIARESSQLWQVTPHLTVPDGLETSVQRSMLTGLVMAFARSWRRQ
jgi:hypothetical protein